MKIYLLTLILALSSTSAFATGNDLEVRTTEVKQLLPEKNLLQANPIGQIGTIISTAGEIVALGERVYTLVQKGKPSVVTQYAPLSIVPKDPISKEVVSPLDLEDCSMPAHKSFKTTLTTAGIEVVNFEYMVFYSHSCSYNGAGKYIQALVIVPVRVKVGYGWDFNASMKLSGIINHGKKSDPLVGGLLTMQYSVKNWRSALERNDTMYVMGNGQFQSYSVIR